MPKYRVVEGWQVKHDGEVLRGGKTFDAPKNNLLQAWLSAGWVEEVKETRSEPKTPSRK